VELSDSPLTAGAYFSESDIAPADSVSLIFSSRQFRHRQAVASAEYGIAGNSLHQHAPSGWHVIGASHLAHRVCTQQVFSLLRKLSSSRALFVHVWWTVLRRPFLVSRANRMLSWTTRRTLANFPGCGYIVLLQ
jgi:hypothetical protein